MFESICNCCGDFGKEDEKMNDVTTNGYVYVIRANRKNNLYIGFTNLKNTLDDKIKLCAQNVLEFALYFKDQAQARQFLDTYFDNIVVKLENMKYYEIMCVKTDLNLDSEIFMFDVPCYFSSDSYKKWRKAPHAYSVKKTFRY